MAIGRMIEFMNYARFLRFPRDKPDCISAISSHSRNRRCLAPFWYRQEATGRIEPFAGGNTHAAEKCGARLLRSGIGHCRCVSRRFRIGAVGNLQAIQAITSGI
jgi:hypothetical protein